MHDSTNADPCSEAWAAIRTHLEAARRAAMHEIRHYPQPIAGCDAQIPVLWERRDAISAEIARLEVAARDPSPDAVARFLATTAVIAESDRQALLDRARTRRAGEPAPEKSATE